MLRFRSLFVCPLVPEPALREAEGVRCEPGAEESRGDSTCCGARYEQSNEESNSGSNSTRNLESNGQSYGESNEDSNSDRSGQSDRWGNG